MTQSDFTPVVYAKDGCPFCLKLRLFLLEAGLMDNVVIREFVPGTAEEAEMRAVLEPHFQKVSFPSIELAPGRFMAESDNIIAELATQHGVDTESLSGLRAYRGVMKYAMELRQENMKLKAAQ